MAATGKLMTRRIDRHDWKQASLIHSPLVLLLSAIPGFGAVAYLAAKPVRSNRLLMRVTLDAVIHKVRGRLYERSGMRRVIARPADVAVDNWEPAWMSEPCAVEFPAVYGDEPEVGISLRLFPLHFWRWFSRISQVRMSRETGGT